MTALRAVRALSGRSVAQAGAGFALCAVLLIWGLPRFGRTTWAEVWQVVGTVTVTNGLLYLALVLLGLWSYTLTLAASMPGLSHARAFIVNICGSSVSNLLPGGGAVGLAATLAICRSWGFRKRAVSTSAIVTGVWNTLARIALPLIAVATLTAGRSGMPSLMRNAAIAAVLSGLALVVLVGAAVWSQELSSRIGHGLDWALRPLLRRTRRTMSIDALVADLRERIIDVVRAGWLPLTLGLVGYFGFYYLAFLAVMRTSGVDLFHGELFAAFAIGRLLTAVGVTPGGLGVSEAGTAAALVAWGAAPAEATAGVVLFSIFTHLLEVPLGALGWLAWSVLPKTPLEVDDDTDADPPDATSASRG
ncbi:MAG TPA: lysylphosphatidylglycerol synthase domain-containing protein [Tetrasphaera sp.]|nr:lysylphosphatidylglycerol synthase domain-containing protein [Tetrasphaera sp.]